MRAKKIYHHPDIDFRFNKVTLTLTTHDEGGIAAVVIGSGFIGMEVASVLASRGVQTTMVFPEDDVWKHLFTRSIPTFFGRLAAV